MKAIAKPLPQPYRVQIVEDDRVALNALIDKTWERVKDNIELPGFRKGHVLRSVAEKKYSLEVLYKDALDELLVKGLEEAKLSVFQVTDITVEWFDDKQPMIISAVCLLNPTVLQCDYENVKVAYESLTVTDAEIEANLTRLAFGEAEEVVVETEIDKENWAVVDFQIHDGLTEISTVQKDYSTKATKTQYGFESSLVGHKAGDSYEVPVKLSPNFFNAELRGKDVYFKINVHKVYKLAVPALDDALAKKIGFADFAEMRNKIKGDLVKEKAKADVLIHRDTVLSAVIAKTEFSPIPDRMITEELDRIFAAHLEEINRKSQTQITVEAALKQLKTTKEQWYASQWSRGVRKVQLSLLLDYIADKMKLDCTDQDYAAEFKTLVPEGAKDVKVDRDQLVQYIKRKKAQEFLVAQTEKNK